MTHIGSSVDSTGFEPVISSWGGSGSNAPVLSECQLFKEQLRLNPEGLQCLR